MTPGPHTLRNERGFALFSTFLLLLLLATLGSASMLYSVLDLKSTTHYNTGNQAFFAAESGVEHALSTMNSVGVIDFQQDIVLRWSTLYGTGAKAIPGYPKVTYTITLAANGADPANAGTITATGFAPLQAQRVVRIGVRRSNKFGNTGAIHLAADAVGTVFDGDAFLVDGNDYKMDGSLNAAGTSHTGISTRNDGVTGAVVGSLDDRQKDNVRGLGFSSNPLRPSVQTVGGPSASDLSRMVSDILAKPGVVNRNDHNINNSGETFGSVSAPQITHLTNPNVNVNGSITGAGILIADGSIEITGTIDFIGWIIVRGNTVIHTQTANDGTTVLGNATIKGSLWTADFDVEVGGSASVKYCEECLSLAGIVGGGGSFPTPMEVRTWQEVL